MLAGFLGGLIGLGLPESELDHPIKIILKLDADTTDREVSRNQTRILQAKEPGKFAIVTGKTPAHAEHFHEPQLAGH